MHECKHVIKRVRQTEKKTRRSGESYTESDTREYIKATEPRAFITRNGVYVYER